MRAGAAAADDFPTPLTMPNMPLHDPYVLAGQASQTYYLYTANQQSVSGASGAVMVYRSKNLHDSSAPTVVYSIESGGWARSQNGACDRHRVDRRPGLRQLRPGVAEPELPRDRDRGGRLAARPVRAARQDRARHPAQLHDARRDALSGSGDRQAVARLCARV